jgi:hypothetical protein
MLFFPPNISLIFNLDNGLGNHEEDCFNTGHCDLNIGLEDGRSFLPFLP